MKFFRFLHKKPEDNKVEIKPTPAKKRPKKAKKTPFIKIEKTTGKENPTVIWVRKALCILAVLSVIMTLVICAWNIISVLLAGLGFLVDLMRRGYPPKMDRLMEIILGEENPPKGKR